MRKHDATPAEDVQAPVDGEQHWPRLQDIGANLEGEGNFIHIDIDAARAYTIDRLKMLLDRQLASAAAEDAAVADTAGAPVAGPDVDDEYIEDEQGPDESDAEAPAPATDSDRDDTDVDDESRGLDGPSEEASAPAADDTRGENSSDSDSEERPGVPARGQARGRAGGQAADAPSAAEVKGRHQLQMQSELKDLVLARLHKKYGSGAAELAIVAQAVTRLETEDPGGHRVFLVQTQSCPHSRDPNAIDVRTGRHHPFFWT